MTPDRRPPMTERGGDDLRPYTFRDYLIDRLPHVVILVVAVLLALTFVQLLLWNVGLPLSWADAAYIALLVALVVAAWLAAGWLRRKSFARELAEAWRQAAAGDAAASLSLASPVTREQRAMAALLERLYTVHANELSALRRQQEFHRHFTARWVHQMKTPLSVIELLMQRHPDPADDARPGDTERSVLEETDRLRHGLDTMLHTSRLDKFELDASFRTVSLSEIVRAVLGEYKRPFIRRSIFPSLEGEATTETDAKWLAFILGQLVSNAIKYAKKSEGPQRLLIRIEGYPDGSAQLRVTDEGIGIAAEDLPRLFEPFFTGSNGRLNGESTGMGLYLAKQACARLGIGLRIDSELGAGTTATLDFRPSGIHRLTDERNQT
ncbi:sensor histidine kinase [Cohnella hashimotonis]|uniref:histidine kinase n=1 Tax=Cohnella hashimotonis TaxID=2826895 RepID=A0ABT6TI72_9BACL|nr:sensor histidine kinase [Cohnella hashimotonis]MDI4646522.1 sensor histidine kinase [Cohnella hashimotonis]